MDLIEHIGNPVLQAMFADGSEKDVHHIAQRIGNLYDIALPARLQIFLVLFFHQIETEHEVGLTDAVLRRFSVADAEYLMEMMHC
jgi:hypothetical protein